MPSPFPGMDPYIEKPPIWPDFHDAFVAAIRGLLQPQLRPRYVALMQERWFVVESDRPIRPDVSIVTTDPVPERSGPAIAATIDVDAPTAEFDIWLEDVKQPYLQIIEPAAGNRVVTAIEVLSPDNKASGPGRDSYLKKRDEYWNGGANLVEIDLLRGGLRTVRLNEEQFASLGTYRYLAAVTRRLPAKHEIHALPLAKQLPKIAIPLAFDDQDVSLNLQAAMDRVWDEGPYPALLRYEDGPPADLTPTENAWCCEQLARV